LNLWTLCAQVFRIETLNPKIFMKPTPHLSSNPRHSRDDSRALGDHRSFPLTDCSFQSSVETIARPTATSDQGVSELRTFRKISSDFFGAEAGRDYIAEAIFFVCIAVIAAWPVTVMVGQLMTMMI
jgi:hypothetical protein